MKTALAMLILLIGFPVLLYVHFRLRRFEDSMIQDHVREYVQDAFLRLHLAFIVVSIGLILALFWIAMP